MAEIEDCYSDDDILPGRQPSPRRYPAAPASSLPGAPPHSIQVPEIDTSNLSLYYISAKQRATEESSNADGHFSKAPWGKGAWSCPPGEEGEAKEIVVQDNYLSTTSSSSEELDPFAWFMKCSPPTQGGPTRRNKTLQIQKPEREINIEKEGEHRDSPPPPKKPFLKSPPSSNSVLLKKMRQFIASKTPAKKKPPSEFSPLLQTPRRAHDSQAEDKSPVLQSSGVPRNKSGHGLSPLEQTPYYPSPNVLLDDLEATPLLFQSPLLTSPKLSSAVQASQQSPEALQFGKPTWKSSNRRKTTPEFFLTRVYKKPRPNSEDSSANKPSSRGHPKLFPKSSRDIPVYELCSIDELPSPYKSLGILFKERSASDSSPSTSRKIPDPNSPLATYKFSHARVQRIKSRKSLDFVIENKSSYESSLKVYEMSPPYMPIVALYQKDGFLFLQKLRFPAHIQRALAPDTPSYRLSDLIFIEEEILPPCDSPDLFEEQPTTSKPPSPSPKNTVSESPSPVGKKSILGPYTLQGQILTPYSSFELFDKEEISDCSSPSHKKSVVTQFPSPKQTLPCHEPLKSLIEKKPSCESSSSPASNMPAHDIPPPNNEEILDCSSPSYKKSVVTQFPSPKLTPPCHEPLKSLIEKKPSCESSSPASNMPALDIPPPRKKRVSECSYSPSPKKYQHKSFDYPLEDNSTSESPPSTIRRKVFPKSLTQREKQAKRASESADSQVQKTAPHKSFDYPLEDDSTSESPPSTIRRKVVPQSLARIFRRGKRASEYAGSRAQKIQPLKSCQNSVEDSSTSESSAIYKKVFPESLTQMGKQEKRASEYADSQAQKTAPHKSFHHSFEEGSTSDCPPSAIHKKVFPESLTQMGKQGKKTSKYSDSQTQRATSSKSICDSSSPSLKLPVPEFPLPVGKRLVSEFSYSQVQKPTFLVTKKQFHRSFSWEQKKLVPESSFPNKKPVVESFSSQVYSKEQREPLPSQVPERQMFEYFAAMIPEMPATEAVPYQKPGVGDEEENL